MRKDKSVQNRSILDGMFTNVSHHPEKCGETMLKSDGNSRENKPILDEIGGNGWAIQMIKLSWETWWVNIRQTLLKTKDGNK